MINNKIINLKLDRNLFAIFFIIGFLTNGIVFISNDYKMPVNTEIKLNTSEHFNYIDKEEVKFWLLSDIIRVPSEKYLIMLSLGDLIICLSILMLLVYQIEIVVLSLKEKKNSSNNRITYRINGRRISRSFGNDKKN